MRSQGSGRTRSSSVAPQAWTVRASVTTGNLATYAAPVTEVAAPLDLTDPAVVADPYPSFARAREVAPVQWHEGLQLWLAFSHTEANAVLRDRRLGRIWRGKETAERFGEVHLIHPNPVLEMGPPEHTPPRRAVHAALPAGDRGGPRPGG